MGRHGIRTVEGFIAARAFSHTVGNPVFHTLVAEDVAAASQVGVLEVASADGADHQVLVYCQHHVRKLQG